ncbi:MAG: sulfite exporter TauE/SafE family protein [Hyphomonadaceae bacterium]|nr:sulfite exporter TauE/SafE family protein [Clostridia bacterium]
MILIAIGIIAGIISGMGIGGGSILIPVLVLVMGISQITAQSINLIFFIPTACAALFIHFREKNIMMKEALCIALFGVAGAWVGAYCVQFIAPELLKRMFALFLLGMGVFEMVKKTG